MATNFYDLASLILVQPVTKPGTAYSLKPDDGSGDFTNTRNSEASRYNDQGLLVTEPIDQIRQNYDPAVPGGCPVILLEASRTNNLLYSEEHDNAYWSKAGMSITANNLISPDGNQTADIMFEDTSTGFHSISRSFTQVVGQWYVFSAFFKLNLDRGYWIVQGGTSGGTGATSSVKINPDGSLSEAPTGTSYKLTQLPNDWMHIAIWGEAVSTSSANTIYLAKDGERDYTGDGVSTGSVWGIEKQQGTYPTQYIKTTSATVTRAIDQVESLAPTPALYNDNEGVIFFDGQTFGGADTFLGAWGVFDASTNTNRVILYYQDTRIRGLITGQGTGSASVSFTIDRTQAYKMALRYNIDGLQLWVDGQQRDTTVILTYPIGFDRIRFNNINNGTQQLKGNHKLFMYFPVALTDAQMTELTTQ